MTAKRPTPHGVLLCGALLLSSPVAAKSPTWTEMSATAQPEAFKVMHYLDLEDDSRLVILAAGSEQGIVAGSTFKAFRPAPNEILVETGFLKAVEVQTTYTIATVETQGSRLSKAFFPKFSGVMAGDLAIMQRLTLTRRQAVMPSVTLSYFDLFDDPKSEPSSFELKTGGVARIRDVAATFATARLSTLMVEGYTDHHGSSQANQVESYQRALTVRQYLVDELGFDPERVIAVGYGEAEPSDESLSPGYIQANRRIVLKAVPSPE